MIINNLPKTLFTNDNLRYSENNFSSVILLKEERCEDIGKNYKYFKGADPLSLRCFHPNIYIKRNVAFSYLNYQFSGCIQVYNNVFTDEDFIRKIISYAVYKKIPRFYFFSMENENAKVYLTNLKKWLVINNLSVNYSQSSIIGHIPYLEISMVLANQPLLKQICGSPNISFVSTKVKNEK